MTKELSKLEKTLEQSKKQFVTSATRVTRELDRRRKALRCDLERANKRAQKSREQLRKKTERLANTTANKAKRELRKQIRALEKAFDEARSEAAEVRDDLKPVMDDLKSARKHLTHALRIDKALAKKEKGVEPISHIA